jgi:phytoene dehydrogenase-like protein
VALARAPRYEDLIPVTRNPSSVTPLSHGERRLDGGGEADRALRVLIGVETQDEVDDLWADVRAGRLPEPRGMVVSVPSLHDMRQAPAGHHVAVLLQPVPYAPDGSADNWDALAPAYADRCLAAWRQYARNLTDADILARVPLTPRDVAARYGNLARGALGMGAMVADQAGPHRPLPELADYRTPIRNLYLCGTCMHPGPGWLGAAGHNAAQVVLQDLTPA